MHRKLTLTLALTALALGACCCAGPRVRSAAEIGPLGHSFTMTWDGREREVVLFVPSTWEAGQHLPLVLALHGGGSHGEGMEKFGGFNRLGEEKGFLVAYPSGVDNQWNDGRNDPISEAHAQKIDDVGFLDALTDKLVADYGVDATRIYVTGISNGGMMTHRLACERADRYAAFAPVATNMPTDTSTTCAPTAPAPMILMNGTDDPLVPYGGGAVTVLGKERGTVIGTDAVVAFYLERNGCAAAPTTQRTLDADPDDETSVQVSRYEDGCPDAPVHLYKVVGGGHTWPGGAQYLGKWLIGRVTRELSAEETIWAFFATNHRDPATR